MSKNDTMKYNFDLLIERLLDTIKSTSIDKHLQKIKGNTLCVGSGGSKVVASFASIVFNHKHNSLCKVMEPRDVLYTNTKNYKNLFMCSYSGNNHGVNILNNVNIKKHLFTYGDIENKNFNKLKCISNIDKEMSFISLAATLMPMGILLSYHLKNDTITFIESILKSIDNFDIKKEDIDLPFDLISGEDTLSAETYLESTFAESAISDLVVHHKYDYCHGRSTLSYKFNKNLIYLVSNKKELDILLLEQLKQTYKNIIVLESNFDDPIMDNFNLTLKSMYLSKYLATLKNIDLSIVDYNKPICKKLYKYQGEM